MRDKKQKQQKTEENNTPKFEIHTMRSDNELKKQQSQPQPPKPLVQEPIKDTNSQQIPENNPFLSDETLNQEQALNSPGAKSSISKSTNVPPKPPKIAKNIPQKKSTKQAVVKSKKQTTKKSKKGLLVFIIIIVLVLLAGAAAFGVYMLKASKNTNNQVVDIENDDYLNQDVGNTIDSEDAGIVEGDSGETEEVPQTYATDIPNYFAVDVESETTQEDIENELSSITSNMTQENIQGPIRFIVTDSNHNPLSFHVFAMSAGMNVPQDILSALEETFELYAYMDDANGVRFGFNVEIKNIDALYDAMRANEPVLPKVFDIFLAGKGANATNVVFNDSTYGTHAIRYYNLDSTESYSVDYTISEMHLFVGTSKNTLRQILDNYKNTKNQQEAMSNEEDENTNDNDMTSQNQLQADSNNITFVEALSSCTVYTDTIPHMLTGEEIERRILGFEGENCLYEEDMPNNGKMVCKFPENIRIATADFYEKMDNAEEVNTSTQANATADGSTAESKTIIDGKEVDNMLQYNLEQGYCVIEGYE